MSMVSVWTDVGSATIADPGTGAMRIRMPTVRPAAIGIGAVTLAVLLLWPRVTKKIPAPLVALIAGAVVGGG